MAPDWPESPAAVALRELQQVAGEALPEDSAELFAALLAKPQDELVRLLAVCVASTVDVVTPRATAPQPGEDLAQAVGLDRNSVIQGKTVQVRVNPCGLHIHKHTK